MSEETRRAGSTWGVRLRASAAMLLMVAAGHGAAPATAQSASPDSTASAGSSPPALASPAARPGPAAVWDPPAGAIDRAHEALAKSTDAQAALQAGMRAGAATPAALAFAARLGEDAGYLGEREEAGPLIIGKLYFPVRANQNEEPCVIDAANRLVRPAVDDPVKPAELAALPAYQALHPSGALEAMPPHDPPKRLPGADGGIELVYQHPLSTCHACPVEGIAHVVYVFGAGGVYRSRRLVDVTAPPPEPAGWPKPSAQPGAAK